ncbi:MAG: hypothetical protein LBS61_02660 [Endomicrobium sp.]|nr:hypothetical protein [Endomicrobium sp.]
MKKIKYLALFLFTVVMLNSCGVTYKKETLTQDLEKLVEKEAGQKSKAYVVGKTLYLDMQVEGLASPAAREAFSKALRKVQTAGVDISRVVLSGDSDIKFMVVTAYDPAHTVLFRLAQNADDIKKYFYMRISRSDYESRSLVEIFGHSIAKIINDKRDISQEEFVGRLIASKLNALQASGWSFLYGDVRNKILFLVLLEQYNKKNAPLIENFLREQLKNYSKKYNNPFDSVEVLNLNGTKAMSVTLNVE